MPWQAHLPSPLIQGPGLPAPQPAAMNTSAIHTTFKHVVLVQPLHQDYWSCDGASCTPAQLIVMEAFGSKIWWFLAFHCQGIHQSYVILHNLLIYPDPPALNKPPCDLHRCHTTKPTDHPNRGGTLAWPSVHYHHKRTADHTATTRPTSLPMGPSPSPKTKAKMLTK
jgi:hypothetical protein